MGIETYILIAVCYGLGCRLSYKLGRRKGGVKAISDLCDVIAALTKKEPAAVNAEFLAAMEQAKKALKS